MQHVIPFATYRPIAWAEARDDATNPTCVILHLTASEATSQHGYFSNPANKACSNTHVARSGHIEQYIRGDRLSAADSYGSSRAFSIETQGADANGRWTPEQCESIARIIAWAHQTYGIPLRLMTSSATGEHGIGWHRLGVNGNFPSMPNILAGRMQRGGGEVWSSAFGKVCPGDNRIKQIPAILDRAIAIVAGADTNPGGFMPDLTEKDQRELKDRVDDIYALLTTPIKDGRGAAPPRAIWERVLNAARRVLANQLADEVVPVEVDVDAGDVADALVERLDALLERLPADTARTVVDTLTARLSK
ncbi:N-acetylmuramoyl-L-alanine amidase [Promicromonospora sp. NFX87]|uniref:peptidoglycan recognition protein family protein n=1 Tax=Promicromonospora sp. NFX87 TaxID=3402691 RepID=UPI003AFA1477